MPLHVILAAGAISLAIPLLWWSVATSQTPSKAVSRNLAGGRVSTTDLRQGLLQRSAADRAVKPAIHALAEQAVRLTPRGFVNALERRIVLAGHQGTWPIERVLAAKLLLGAAGLGVGSLRTLADLSIGSIVITLVAAGIGYFVPDMLLWVRARDRQQTIRQELPDTLDEVTVSVEAGLGFEAALARAGRAGHGPIAEELIRTMQEMQIGVPRRAALRHLVDRTDVSDLRHFVVAIIQAEDYGVPVAQVLRVHAAELRVKRRQYAEERAMKIPVKVVFPLVLCILPAMFVIILGPAAIRIAGSVVFGG
jgi:tight adherence protein C